MDTLHSEAAPVDETREQPWLHCVYIVKDELLQLKPRPFICMRNFIIKKELEKKTKKTTKSPFIISVLKVEYKVVLVSSISNFFSNKTSHANKWIRKKIPT